MKTFTVNTFQERHSTFRMGVFWATLYNMRSVTQGAATNLYQ